MFAPRLRLPFFRLRVGGGGGPGPLGQEAGSWAWKAGLPKPRGRRAPRAERRSPDLCCIQVWNTFWLLRASKNMNNVQSWKIKTQFCPIHSPGVTSRVGLVRMRMHICAHAYVCIFVRMRMHVCAHDCAYMCACACMCARVTVRVCVRACACMRPHMYIPQFFSSEMEVWLYRMSATSS